MSLKNDLLVVARLPLNTPANARMALPPQTDITYFALGACALIKVISDSGILCVSVTGSGIGPSIHKQLLQYADTNFARHTGWDPQNVILYTFLCSRVISLGWVDCRPAKLEVGDRPESGRQIIEFDAIRNIANLDPHRAVGEVKTCSPYNFKLLLANITQHPFYLQGSQLEV